MRVSLINPLWFSARGEIAALKMVARTSGAEHCYEPLGLACIAAFLREAGHEVQIIDRNVMLMRHNYARSRTDSETFSRLQDFGPDAVGFSTMTPSMQDVEVLSGNIRRRHPGVLMIAGGHHATAEPLWTLESCPSLDVVVRGEGEETIAELANGTRREGILGITYRDDGRIASNSDRPSISDLDALPLPARDLLEMDAYNAPKPLKCDFSERYLIMFTSRGCPYRCEFCYGSRFFGRAVRYRSPDQVIDEVRRLAVEHAAELIFFADDMFLANRRRAREICTELIRSGLNRRVKWIAQLRADHAEEELLRLMKEAGCVNVDFGFESGSQRILDVMGKRASVADYYHAARLTHEAGLRFKAFIMFGYPGETNDDFQETVKLLRDTRPDKVEISCFYPIPGTPIYKKLKEQGCPMNFRMPFLPLAMSHNYSSMSAKEIRRNIYRYILPFAPEVEKQIKSLIPIPVLGDVLLRAMLLRIPRNPVGGGV
jgi:anaerobic magnesium-protoporphyrin IX monomethyl ester cyclase